MEVSTDVGVKFANDLLEFAQRSTEGTSWKVVDYQLPQPDANDKSKYYDVRIILKLDIEKLKQAVLNPEGYEDDYEEDFSNYNDSDANVEKFEPYDNVMIEIVMRHAIHHMTTPRVIMSWETREGMKKPIVVERIHFVSDETYNNVVVFAVETLIVGEDDFGLSIPEEAAQRYGLLLNRV